MTTYYLIDLATVKLTQVGPGQWNPTGRGDILLLEYLADVASDQKLFTTSSTDAWLSSTPDVVAVADITGYLSNRRWTSVGRDQYNSWVEAQARAAQTALQALSNAKTRAMSRIDARTDDLIAAGFVVGGKTFSASDAAQMKWLGMYASKDALSYPVTVPTVDDSSFVTLVDAADVVTYYTALLSHVQSTLASGIVLKAQVTEATDLAGVAAVVDNR